LRKIHHTYSICIVIMMLFFTACGYHFSGGGQLPDNVTRICVKVFENKTSETGLENSIANDIIYYFTRFENVALVDKEEAQATLTGVIMSSSTSSVAHKSSDVTMDRRIRIVVDVKLTAANGDVLWKSGPTSGDETYQVVAGNVQTEENKKIALAKISKRLAERFYYLMTENF
jgi:outer membrane lipopolysaccharide assembly protein LptE/RlpB